MVFMLETEGMTVAEKDAILEQWQSIISNKLLIVPKGSLKVLDIEHE